MRRTEDYYRNGPKGPATWVLTAGKNIPVGAFVGGEFINQPAYVARGFLQVIYI